MGRLTREPFDLRRVIKEAEGEMLAKAQAAAVRHHGARGSVREELLADLLRKHLPRSLSVAHSAEIVRGARSSGQCDIVIYDSEVPPIVDYDSHHVVAGDAVLGVVEVKSRLTVGELDDAYEHLYDARGVSGWFGHPGGAAGWIIAYQSSGLEKLRQALEVHHASHASVPHMWLDGIWVLSGGAIVWVGPNGRPEPSPGEGRRLRTLRSDSLIFLMLWLMNERLRRSGSRAIDMLSYTGSAGGALPMWEFVD